MKRIEKKKFSGGNWMDTYGDMVTLLLCFFVLLYSISTVDTVKWMNFVRSLNPDSDDVTQLVQDPEKTPDAEDPVPGDTDLLESTEQKAINEDFKKLYEELKKLAIESDGDMTVTHGKDFVFVMFNDKVIFDGDSWVLRPEGKKVLDKFARIIDPLSKSIKEIQIMGHTTQALPDKRNPIESDRTLSAMRAAKVTIYIQEKGIISAGKLVSLGYGQHHPVASFKTEEDRSKNRRVEIMLTKKGGAVKSLEDYYADVTAQMEADAQQNQDNKNSSTNTADEKTASGSAAKTDDANKADGEKISNGN